MHALVMLSTAVQAASLENKLMAHEHSQTTLGTSTLQAWEVLRCPPSLSG